MKNNLILDKSFDFALDIIRFYQILQRKNEFVLSKQLLRSGTGIGALVNEATAAESRKDFVHKMSIASKEARETKYWLRLLHRSQLVAVDYSPLLKEISSICRILTSIVKSTKERNSH